MKVIFVALIALLCANGFAQQKPQQKPDLKETVKWAVWHEGCRIYAADNSIGDVEEIRECIVGVYAQNDDARQMVQAATGAQMLVAVRTAGREIPAERGIRERVAYACKHEDLLATFIDLETKNDYEGIRTLYFSTFKSDENVRNLLAAVSDESLGDLINENK